MGAGAMGGGMVVRGGIGGADSGWDPIPSDCVVTVGD
jgi:hypothetical protein